MKQAILDSYKKKLYQLANCCVWLQKAYEIEVEEKYRDTPIYGEIWMHGGYSGALIYFLRSLTEEEREISDMVFARIRRDKGNEADISSVVNYIGASIKVLEDMGCHILLPEDF